MIFVQITATQALREELTSVERRAEEERAAHNSTKMVYLQISANLFFCFSSCLHVSFDFCLIVVVLFIL